MTRTALALAALAGGILLGAAGKPLPGAGKAHPNWNVTVARTATDSYVLGNPDAPVKLVEYISYTCPHCATFEREAADQLRLGFIAKGKGSVEVRAFVRDPVDMTAAVLVRCGAKEKFFTNHTVFLRTQSTWAARLAAPSPSQRQRWFMTTELTTRMRYIATDFGFYGIMSTLGYDRRAVDTCLANTALAERLAKQTEEADTAGNVHGTPTFMIDGIVLAGTNSWDMLRPQLEARMP